MRSIFKRASLLLLCLMMACHGMPALASEAAPDAAPEEAAAPAEPAPAEPPASAPEPAATPEPVVTPEPATEAPATEPPATAAPVTEAPVTEAPATEAPATGVPATEAPATNVPQDTPAPQSRLRVEDYAVLDLSGHPLNRIERDDKVYLVLTLSDSGVTTAQAGRVSVSHENDSFELIDERPQVPQHDGQPHVEVLSGPSSPLRLRVTFPNARYSGEEKALRFAVHYASGVVPPMMDITINECVPSDPPTPVPATDVPATDAPATDTPTTDVPATDVPATDTPATDAPATDASATDAPATDAPATDAPATDAPATDAPVTDAPATDVPATGQPQETPVPGEVEPPLVFITRGELGEIKAGDEFAVDVVFTNKGTVDVELPVVTFTMPDGLILREKTTSFALEKMAPGASTELRIRLTAREDLSEPQQMIDALLKFEYLSAGRIRRASTSEKLLIPVKPAPKIVKAPLIEIGRTDFAAPVQAGQSFPLTLWFRNSGTVAAQNVVASLSPSDALSLTESSSSLLIRNIPAGETVSATVNMRAAAEIQSALQFVQVDAKYDYAGDKEAMQGSAAEKVLIPAVVKVRKMGGGGAGKPVVEPPVPNVIVSRYNYGAGQIAAGAEFPLSLTIQNTSASRSVENMMMTIETDEGVTITSASNTVYVRELSPGEEKSSIFKMQALPNIKTGSSTATITFKYEYVVNDKRSSNTLTEKISIPLYQPDRMQISAPQGPESVTEGEEATLSIAYFNKGKSDVYNLSAEIQGDVDALTRTQTPGNIEPGKSGTIDFIVTPKKAGVAQFNIVVTYEDATQTQVSRTFPVNLKVSGLPDLPLPDDMPDEGMDKAEEAGKTNWYLYLVPAGMVALLTGLSIHSRRKRKKLEKQASSYTFDE